MILDVYVLRVGIDNGRYAFATAAGLFKAVINLTLLLSANAITKRVSGKGLF
jgi:putative aldouronate transport system permease protein